MDEFIEYIGRDTFFAVVVYIGVTCRSGKGEKVNVVHGLFASFVPFFPIMCLLIIFEYLTSLVGLVIPAKPLGAIGGIFGFLSNSWIIGLDKDGKYIEEHGAVKGIQNLVKEMLTFKKQS